MDGNDLKLAGRVQTLEAQLAWLTEQFEALTENHHSLRDRLLTLSIATRPHPRFPYFTWYITRNISDETRAELQFLLGRLMDRLDGAAPMPELAHKRLRGIPDDVLYGDAPPSIEEINTAVRWVTGMKHDSQVMELFQALRGQGMLQSLCRFYLGFADADADADIDADADADIDADADADADADIDADADELTQWRRAYADVKRELSILREAIQCLALGKRTDAAHAFDDWLVKNDVFRDRRLHLELVLCALDERRAERPFSVRRSVPGIVDDWLYKPAPPTRDEARNLLMLALDTRDARTIDELFQALATRDDGRDLAAWWNETDGESPA